MKKILIFNVLGLGILASSAALATNYSFRCPAVDKLAIYEGMAVHASLTLGMPNNLEGVGYHNASGGWVGSTEGNYFAYFNRGTSYFKSVEASHDRVSCYYILKGTDANHKDFSIGVSVEPGNRNYREMYSYSLSSDTSTSSNISTMIIANAI